MRFALGLCFVVGFAAESRAQDEARSGPEVYKQLCAVCHGDTGDGKGLVQLDRPARSFKDGGFSFGNTPKAIARTVASGIGGTPMPGFAAMLSQAEIDAVAAYVVSLGPEQPPAVGKDSVLEVGDRPQFVRGHLPSASPGAPDHPRGLLVGTTDGLSWEYAADDLRLIAVRQGSFVNREDWGARGGSPLKPLGKLIHAVDAGFVPTEFGAAASLDSARYVRKLRATDFRDGKPWVETELQFGDGNSAEVHETMRAGSLPAAAGYLREFTVKRSSAAPIVMRLGLSSQGAKVVDAGERGTLAFVPRGQDAGVVYLVRGAKLTVDTGDKLGHVWATLSAEAGTQQLAVLTIPLPAEAQTMWKSIAKEAAQ